MRRLVADNGIVVVMDEKVSEAFDPDADEVEQLMYGFSNFICPTGRDVDAALGWHRNGDAPGHATGIRP